jgi:2-polyprenyl-6-methoxyphenol hydroxylase-like FAD-dependent oxidoreductase
MDLNTSVLIAGGSLNGLTTALLLAHRGVRCIVVERHHKQPFSTSFAGSPHEH